MNVTAKEDGELLRQYVATGNQLSFEAIVERHGGMVLDVCHRITRNEADAKDAAQTTFLLLVKKADELCNRNSIGGWLHHAARYVALRAKETETQQKTREGEISMTLETSVPNHQEAEDKEKLLELLDQELDALPEKYRLPIILHHFEGRTIEEAAEHLGLIVGTLNAQLSRGRAILQKRLAHQGLVLSGTALDTFLTEQASAAIPGTFIISTAQAAAQVSAGNLAVSNALFSESTAFLEEGLKVMSIKKIITIAGALLILALGIGTAVILYQSKKNSVPTIGKVMSITKRDKKQSANSKTPKRFSDSTSKNDQASQTSDEAFSQNEKAAKEFLEQLFSELEHKKSRPPDFTTAFPSVENTLFHRFRQIKDFGEEGSKAIFEFLKSGKNTRADDDRSYSAEPLAESKKALTDFLESRKTEVEDPENHNGWYYWRLKRHDPRQIYIPTFRIALLEILYEMGDPTAQVASLDVLKNTSSGLEFYVATKNLEKFSPGLYRTEVLQAASEFLSKILDPDFGVLSAKKGQDLEAIFEVIGYYQAKEFIPLVEDIIKKYHDRNMAEDWLGRASHFEAEDQVAILQKLDDKNVQDYVVGRGDILSTLDLKNDGVRQFCIRIFAEEMNQQQKEGWIQNLASTVEYPYNVMARSYIAPLIIQGHTHYKGKIEGALQMLNDLEPYLDANPLKEKLEDARKKLQETLREITNNDQ